MSRASSGSGWYPSSAASRLIRSRVSAEMRGLSRNASETVITQTFAAAATSRRPTRTRAWENVRGIENANTTSSALFCEPRPLRLRGEVVPKAVAVERGVGPARNVDEVALPQQWPRIVGHHEGGERGEIAREFGRPATRKRIARTLLERLVRGLPMIPKDVIDDRYAAL